MNSWIYTVYVKVHCSHHQFRCSNGPIWGALQVFRSSHDFWLSNWFIWSVPDSILEPCISPNNSSSFYWEMVLKDHNRVVGDEQIFLVLVY